MVLSAVPLDATSAGFSFVGMDANVTLLYALNSFTLFLTKTDSFHFDVTHCSTHFESVRKYCFNNGTLHCSEANLKHLKSYHDSKKLQSRKCQFLYRCKSRLCENNVYIIFVCL
ncbi:hypothetical protein DPMN_145729 [Dreissena polymorpha]|uniref:Uncharacterized protein n=1 Tax=Dreissena polymorpha TaxID=45954 RepID=A0A9D4F7B5_DREPO|nr:hypothetical protein DPMN_145729 [Dreissena polymorpha]